MRVGPLVLAAAVTFGASPCSAKSAHSYTCDAGTRLTASFIGVSSPDNHVVLTFSSSKKQVLPQAQSADGGRYSDGKTEFWVKGKSAMLTRPNRPATKCST
jgi:membrane-bound inhibitor of C-type lysozyme